ncbi:Monooxygenase FAD-binding protein, partial [Tolypocladium capitatum]
MAREHVTVGIVGGGVAGLALAKMLEMLGVSYTLYESYHEIAPRAGASLGLMPNGLRILDQLGLSDQVEAFSVDHDHWEHRDGVSGTLYKHTTAMRNYPAILGYGAFFMARHDVLQVLFDSLADKTRVHTSKPVVKIQHRGDSALVEATDGSSFTCDFVAGADGVHSIVRQHIFAETAQPPADYLRAHATCVFGISKPLPQIGPGIHFAVYRRKVSALVFSGLRGKLYWFFFEELDEPLDYGQRKRFTDADIQAVYEQIADAIVTDGVRISDVFNSRETAVMTILEEGLSNVWHHGRMFLLGDSAHKMVPHAAMGANQAMEAAACFVNNLRRLQINCPGSPDLLVPQSKVSECLEAYVKERRGFMTAVAHIASQNCRNQLMIGAPAENFIRALPEQNDRELLWRPIESLSKAQKLENWNWGTKRADFYTEQSRKALDIFASNGDLGVLGVKLGEG